jgi:hypothetical protein
MNPLEKKETAAGRAGQIPRSEEGGDLPDPARTLGNRKRVKCYILYLTSGKGPRAGAMPIPPFG